MPDCILHRQKEAVERSGCADAHFLDFRWCINKLWPKVVVPRH